MDFESERISGNVHFKKQEYEKALEIYMGACIRAESVLNEIRALRPAETGSIESLADQLSLLYFNISVSYTKLGFFENALRFVDKALELKCSDKFLGRKALIYSKMGNYRAALQISSEIGDKNECKPIQPVRCADLEDMFKLINYPLDNTFDQRYCQEELLADEGLIASVTREFMEGRVLPTKLICAILREGYATLSNLDNVAFIDTSLPVYVFGDTHGQYFDVLPEIKKIGMKNEVRVVFNGDFVDRGENSVENFILLLLLKLVFPGKVFLNRGNHEFDDLNKIMGFAAEIKEKYRLMHDIVYLFFSKVFSMLPVATVVNRMVFITHGGLPAEPMLIGDIQAIRRSVQGSCSDSRLVGLMWSDPGEVDEVMPSKRGVGVTFGRNVTRRFLQLNNLKLLVRSHEFVTNGFASHHGGSVVTIFSAPNYCQSVSMGAFLKFSWCSSEEPLYEVITFSKHTKKECWEHN
eukprot:jgi/Antlo1/1388/1231